MFGLWTLFVIVLRNFALGFRETPGAVLVSLGAVVLFVGTLQGGLQTFPAVKFWMVSAGFGEEEIARTHAQFNMLGGVLAILLGMVLMTGPTMMGAIPPRQLGLRAAGLLLHLVWCATSAYRTNALAGLLRELDRHNAPTKPWRAQVSNNSLSLSEALDALFGFPGLGWILSGRALVGVPLMFGGSALAWALLLVFSLCSELGLTGGVFVMIQGYLIVSAVLFVAGLWIMLSRRNSQLSTTNGIFH
jgi:hypothetical protein